MAKKEVDKTEQRVQEIIKQLSKWHKGGTTNPSILCSDSFHHYDLTKTTISEYQGLTSELFTLCQQRGDTWTEM